jgi:hypothetical protein
MSFNLAGGGDAKDLSSLLRDREAETVRLRAEINRLRQALSQAEKLQSTHKQEEDALQQQLQNALTLNK